MANNRLLLCEVDDDLNIIDSVVIAKNWGGEWEYRGNEDCINALFWNTFVNKHGLALSDEFAGKPLMPVYVNN